MCTVRTGPDSVGQGRARQDKTGPDSVGHCRAGPNRTERGHEGSISAGQGWARHGTVSRTGRWREGQCKAV